MEIKLLSEMFSEDSKALLLELPEDMISGLKVDAQGNVNTRCLLGMLDYFVKSHDSGEPQETITPEERMNVYNLVFNNAIAVDHKR